MQSEPARITLRPYQLDLVADIRAAMAKYRRVLAVSPVGSGKTVMFSHITQAAQSKNTRVYIVVHRAEIIDQICATLSRFGIRFGRIQPKYTMSYEPVQVAMVQTLVRRMQMFSEPGLLIIDEAHHSVAGTYRKLLDTWSKTRVLGVTATPARLDGRGLDQQFDVLIAGLQVRDLIAQGFLADFEYYAPPVEIDLSSVKQVAGDYNLDQLANAVDKPSITGDAVKHYLQTVPGRPAVAFCINIAHAEHVAESFRSAGILAASIDGRMDRAERAIRVNGLKSGALRVLTSCDLISEGFDVPAISAAILLRPTKSLALAMQQCGRALRLKDDGSRAVILDHVGNVSRHGTPRTFRDWSLHGKIVSDPSGVRQCGLCFKAFEKAEIRAAQDTEMPCGRMEDAECLFYVKPDQPASQPAFALGPATIDGDLVRISESPEWAGGINLARASGHEFHAMVARADTIEKLQEIARIRGYKRRWVYFIMKSRRERVGENVE